MRLTIHDFSGHPFQVQLSRELAARGHDVMHGYSAQFVTGRGRMTIGPDDPKTLCLEALECDRPMIKYSPIGRLRFELSYAQALRRSLERNPADVVVACNIPLFALDRLRRWFAARQQPWVLWHQDLYSLGVGGELTRKLPTPVAAAARRLVERIECRQVREASRVVAITDAMREQYLAWGIDRDVDVISNWAPLEDVRPGQRENSWSREHDLPRESARLLYAGTLGRKHNPLLLLDLLDAVKRRGVDATLIVASEGIGVDELKAAAGPRPDLRVVGYQPIEVFGDMLASADAFLALLEPDASRFSVPSKVLTYLAAGRPVVALMPVENQAAADVVTVGGFVGAPTTAGVDAAADWLVSTSSDPRGFAKIGAAARAMAEDRFDIARIGDAFEGVLKMARDGAVSGEWRADMARTLSGEIAS